jgi:hypothetical protein
MNLPDLLSTTVIVALFLAGGLFLLPAGIRRDLEKVLNRNWGGQEIFALRLCVPGERLAERLLNREVLQTRFTWDDWTRSHPHVTGIFLWGVGLTLAWLA